MRGKGLPFEQRAGNCDRNASGDRGHPERVPALHSQMFWVADNLQEATKDEGNDYIRPPAKLSSVPPFLGPSRVLLARKMEYNSKNDNYGPHA